MATVNPTLFVSGLLIAFSPCARAVQSFGYIANAGDATVSVFNLATETVVDTVDIPADKPWSVATHPDGSRVYVSTNVAVHVIDTASNTVVESIGLDLYSNESIAISPDGSRVYAEGQDGQKFWKFMAIDTTLNEVVASSNSFPLTEQFSVSPDSTKLYDTGGFFLGVRDALTLELIQKIPLAADYKSVVAHPDGQSLFLGSNTSVLRLDAQTYKADWRAELTPNGQFENLLVSTDGGRIYAPALGEETTFVLDAATGAVLGEIPVASRGISQHPLGHRLYITLSANDRIAIVDAQTLEVLEVVPVGDNPASTGANFVTPFLCGPTLYGQGAGNGASLTAAGDGTTGSNLTLSYAQPPADASFAFSYVALGSDAAPFLGETLLLDAGQLLFPTPGVAFSSAGQVLEESLPIAADPALVNLDVFLQAAFVELSAPNTVTLSNGVSLTVCAP